MAALFWQSHVLLPANHQQASQGNQTYIAAAAHIQLTVLLTDRSPPTVSTLSHLAIARQQSAGQLLLLRSCDGSVDIEEQVPVALAAANHCRLADRQHVGIVIMEPLVALQETAGTTARPDITATLCDMADDTGKCD